MPNFLFRNTATDELIRITADLPLDMRSVLDEGNWDIALTSDWAETGVVIPNPASRPTHVFLLAGQSNATCRAAFDGGVDWPSNVYQMERWHPLEPVDSQPIENLVPPNEASLLPASRPLHHHYRTTPEQFGWALQFSLDYLAMHPGIDVVLIPCARGATGFSDMRWRPGDDLYEDAVLRSNTLLTTHPEFLFQGILWHQGERDANEEMSSSQYTSHLDAMIAGMRADIEAAVEDTPFILGEMLPSYVEQAPERQAIQTVIQDTPNRINQTSVVVADGTQGSDTVHFNAESMRLIGARYASALALLTQSQTVDDTWSISGSTILSAVVVHRPAVIGTTIYEGA
ncbi:MAG: sialate O-acetylesterase [Litoreibacter sp.]